MNFSVDPCDNFYDYACGTWIQNTTLPPGDPIFDLAITTIEENNQAVLFGIMNDSATGAKYPKIIPFYKNCLDTAAIDALGHTPFDLYASQILKFISVSGFVSSVGKLHTLNIPALFSVSVVADPGIDNPEVNVLQLDQGGMNLPSRDMYNTSSQEELLTAYTKHIAAMLTLIGHPGPEAAAASIVAFEEKIAAINLPPDETRDPIATYNYMNVSALQQLTPHMPWSVYFNAIGRPNVTHVIVTVPAYFRALDALVASARISVLVEYARWYLLHNTAPYLDSLFVQETFDFFGKVIDGEDSPPPRAVTCLQATDASLGDIVGEAFADKAFSNASQVEIVAMVEQIETAFRHTLETLPWMDNNTRAAALLKLSQVVRKVGRKSTPSTYPGYEVVDGQYYISVLTKNAYDFAATLSTVDQPPSPDAWEMTADTVNAYYEPTSNSINFPAGILQSPFFSLTRSLAQNYGGIGMVMGHELTHGFDDQGRLYNGLGKLDNWWANSTLQHFQEQTACMVNQYSSFEVLPGVHVNGNLTLGENIADNGGILNAYNAYTAQAGGNTDYPLFFVGYAQGWCSKATPEYQRLAVLADVHSPPRFRVIGPLMNLDYFSTVFSCKAGSYMNPTTKCKVW